jgi:hypothetical protein
MSLVMTRDIFGLKTYQLPDIPIARCLWFFAVQQPLWKLEVRVAAPGVASLHASCNTQSIPVLKP